MKSLLNLKEFESMESAMLAAHSESMNASGRTVMMSMFRQGKRDMLAGSLPVGFVKECCISNPAKKGASINEIACLSTNRPEIPGQKQIIANYIMENVFGNYTLGALTLNISRPMNFYTIKTDSENRMGYLVIPYGTKIETTDGQHRRAAIDLCYQTMQQEQLDEFNRQAIAVVIIVESDVKQIHQDFADASKTKPLPPSLLAAFDLRNPANYVVLHLEENCNMFKGMIDATSKSVGKKSDKLFTASTLRQLVKVMLLGNWQQGNADFDEKAKVMFKNEAEIQIKLNELLPYLNRLTEVIPEWKEATQIDRNDPKRTELVVNLRSKKSVALSSSGVVVLARIGHELLYRSAKAIAERGETWQLYADRLANIDWSCDAEIWKGTLCQPDSKGIMRVLTHQNLIRQAINKVREVIGLVE